MEEKTLELFRKVYNGKYSVVRANMELWNLLNVSNCFEKFRWERTK